MAEELRPIASVELRGEHENIWHIRAAARWGDGRLIGYRTYCGRNYPERVDERELTALADVCSDCTAQVARRH